MKKRVVLKYFFLIQAAALAPLARASAYDDFFAAIARDDPRAIEALLRRGFDLNTLSPDGQHPLYLALRADADRVAAFLLEQPSVQVETRNARGESPLMLAALKGKPALVDRLIERRAEVNKPGWAPLHYAATFGGEAAQAVVRRLLEHHAYIDAASPNGSTPLMMAAMYGHREVVGLLLREGADPLLRNEQGLTAIDFARRADRPDVADMIAASVRARQPAGRW